MSKKEMVETQEPMEMENNAEAWDPMDEGMLPVKKDKATIITDLVELGRSKGKLTAQEIMDSMELFDFDPEQMDKLYEQLEANGIEVVDDFADVSLEDLDFNLETPEQEETEEPAEEPAPVLERHCTQCGAVVPEEAKFCQDCGAQL